MFEGIASDATSGASRLTRQAARELGEAISTLEGKDPGTLWNELTAICRKLVHAQREMAPILNLVGRVLAIAENIVLSGKSPETAVRAMQMECDGVSQFGEERLCELADNGAPLVARGAVIATTSSSESVLSILEAASRSGTEFEVVLSESRPLLEGVTLARRLAGGGIRATLVTDAALPGLVSGADLVLLGADSVSDDSFVNKTGSYALALAAREAGVACYVASLTDKLLPSALRGDPARARDADEVLKAPPEGVAVSNRYFEIVPLALCRGLVTENGIVPVEEVQGMLRERPVPPSLLQLLFAPPPPPDV
jgi:translation initiation factor eIF-2B subunit delta